MSSKFRTSKTVWVVAATAVLAVFMIILFAANSAPGGQSSIVLPTPALDADTENSSSNSENVSGNNDFVIITKDNVATALQTLSRPSSYQQTYTVMTGSENQTIEKTVQLWFNNGIIRADVTSGNQTQSILADGTILYMWYDKQNKYAEFELNEVVDVEDLLGLPDFDAYLQLSPEIVTETEYLYLDESQISCIFVNTEDETLTTRYWVNLENGLLYQVEALENGTAVYSIKQTAFEALATEDEGFFGRFVLPDSSVPFTEEAGTQQP